MKICSIKSISKWLAIAILTSSTTLFAESSSHHSSSHGHRFDKCIKNLNLPLVINTMQGATDARFGALSNIYLYQGVVANPDPAINSAVAGLISSSNDVIIAQGILFINGLQALGVSDVIIDVLANQSLAFDSAAEYYSLAVNMTNTGHIGFNQVQAAIALEQAAVALGNTYLALTGNPQFVTIWTRLADLTTQSVQAARLVLNTDNTFGADPADPFSETVAFTKINSDIFELGGLFVNLLVNELAHETCEDSSNH